MRFLQVLAILGAVLSGLWAVSPVSAEPIYRYCMIGTPEMGRSCTFSTLQQCQATASGGVGFCQENPAYAANARQAMPPLKRR